LAATLKETRFTSEPLLRRAINASLRVGGDEQLETLIAFAKRKDIDKAIRAEALATLGSWANPSVLDRVDGRYRGPVQRNAALVKAKIQPHASALLQQTEPEVLIAVAQMMSQLDMTDNTAALAKLMNESSSPEVRSAMITALSKLKLRAVSSRPLRKA